MTIYNPNLVHLHKSLKDKKRGALLEGSSRSGKTWSGIDFIVYLCSKVETNATINIIRETYNSFKTTLYDDFNKRLPGFGISSPFVDRAEVSSFKLFGNKINLMGADNVGSKLGAGCDYFFGNEGIKIPQPVFDQIEMRCHKFWWYDYNPDAEAKHYVFSVLRKRDDVAHLRTTFLDNPRCPPLQKKKILSYQPIPEEHIAVASCLTPESVKKYCQELKLDEKTAFSVMNGWINTQTNTADAYMWDVFGLGKRADQKGKIYKNWREYTNLPENAKFIGYGIDFGFGGSPAAVVEMWVHRYKLYINGGQRDVEALYYKELIYETGLLDDDLAYKLKDLGLPKRAMYVADCEDAKAIEGLRRKGFSVFKANKAGNAKEWGIKQLQSHPLFFHEKSTNLHMEGDNYLWKMDVNGEPMNVPRDKYNHLMDACRYVATKYLGTPVMTLS